MFFLLKKSFLFNFLKIKKLINSVAGANIGNLEFLIINNNNNQITSIFAANSTKAEKWIIKSIFLSTSEIDFDFILAIDGVLSTSFSGRI